METPRSSATIAPPEPAAPKPLPPGPKQAGKPAAPSSADISATLGLAGGPGRVARVLKRPLTWLVAAAVVVGVVAYVLTHRPAPPVQYATVAAKRGNLSVTVTATGTLAPLDTVIVGTEVSGVIDNVLVDYNDHVRKGQTLAVVNTDILRAQIAQSQAALSAAQASRRQTAATLVQTQAQAVRSESLFAQRVITQEDLETARGDYGRAVAADSAASAQIAVAAAALQAQVTTLGKATIRAPIDGIVLERQVEPGRTVAATLQTPVLFVLAADLKRMTVALNIDEADIGQVKAKQSAEFTVDAYPDHVFTGTVRTVYNAAIMVEGVVTYQAILDVANNDLLLRPGMTATATVKTDTLHDVLLVPNAALRFTPLSEPGAAGAGAGGAAAPGHRVWALGAGGPTPLSVSIGVSDGQWTQVVKGAVAPGTPLVVGIVDRTTGRASAPAAPDTSRPVMPLRIPRGG